MGHHGKARSPEKGCERSQAGTRAWSSQKERGASNATSTNGHGWPMIRRRRVLAVGTTGLVLIGRARVGLAQSPVTASGLPAQIVPTVAETGAPAFQAGTGTSWGGSTGTDTGTGTSTGMATGLGGTGPTNGATAATGGGSTVTYTNADGTTTTLNGGSMAWRNNNPGNLVYNANTAALGAISSNNGFAVFPDVATGSAALAGILNTQTYQNLSVNAAIARYAPAFENNTSAYQAFVTNTLGVPSTTTLSSLSQTQMQSLQAAIQKQEGYTAGSVT